MSHKPLWPYDTRTALIAAPAIWFVIAAVLAFVRWSLGWPSAEPDSTPLLAALLLGLVPVALLLIDSFADRGASVTSTWFSVDFSASVLESDAARPDVFQLPDNILSAEELVTDSGGTRISATIRQATATEIARIDLRDGNAWWVTRLLALCAGAVGVGAPKAIVFTGNKGYRPHEFLGWAPPASIVEAIAGSDPDYRLRLRRATMITRQLALFGDANEPLHQQLDLSELRRELQPARKQSSTGATGDAFPVGYDSRVAEYLSKYDDNEHVLLARVLIGELQSTVSVSTTAAPAINREHPPDRLTISRLHELLDPCLVTESIDRLWDNQKQLTAFLDSSGPYVAVATGGVFKGLLRADVGERVILREVFENVTSAERAGAA